MKIALIGNCQVVSIKAIIDASPLGLQTSAYETWRMSLVELEQLGNSLGQFDTVISQPLISGNFANLGKDTLKDTCQKLGIPLLFIHNLYFEAIIPDCVYVGKMGSRVRGPISDYHSSIVLKSFLNGDSETACLGKLSTGDMMDVPTKWRANVAEMGKRENHVDVTFLEEITSIIKTQDSMHYFNHPKPNMLCTYTEKMLSMLLNQQVSLTPAKDLLAQYGSWPVHSWAAEKLGFDYAANYFLKERFKGEMSFAEFISLSFETYSNTPKDNLV